MALFDMYAEKRINVLKIQLIFIFMKKKPKCLKVYYFNIYAEKAK